MNHDLRTVTLWLRGFGWLWNEQPPNATGEARPE